MESKCLSPLHHGASEAPLGTELLCPFQGGCVSGVQICATSKGLPTNQEERLQGAEGAGVQPGEKVAICPGLEAASAGFPLTHRTSGTPLLAGKFPFLALKTLHSTQGLMAFCPWP